jgi:mannose/fructose/N-acetylgalactosamine-specific phosphotransferase system component IID
MVIQGVKTCISPHTAVGDPVIQVMAPLVCLGIAAGSMGPPAREPRSRGGGQRIP